MHGENMNAAWLLMDAYMYKWFENIAIDPNIKKKKKNYLLDINDVMH